MENDNKYNFLKVFCKWLSLRLKVSMVKKKTMCELWQSKHETVVAITQLPPVRQAIFNNSHLIYHPILRENNDILYPNINV